ncbi:hypothetical protein Tcan_14968 [Toxocara canis]|uniref:Uncharacterized protein n=1 Tax=Toxocara canis TaxID=6265 RepID=A0A0B2V522_TOXCA|nr:hypothetical protein Tcan_14968 [Toxocara canis]
MVTVHWASGNRHHGLFSQSTFTGLVDSVKAGSTQRHCAQQRLIIRSQLLIVSATASTYRLHIDLIDPSSNAPFASAFFFRPVRLRALYRLSTGYHKRRRLFLQIVLCVAV